MAITKIGERPAHWIWGGVTALLMTLLAFGALRAYEEHEAAAEFQVTALEKLDRLQVNIQTALNELLDLGAYFDASGAIDRQTFTRLARPILEAKPYIQALGWEPRVSFAQRAAYTAQARRDGFPDFDFTESLKQGTMISAPARADYYPVYFIVPYHGNEKAQGFNLASDPARREALQHAIDSGEMSATARITFVQETRGQYGFLVFRPVYRGGVLPATLEQRRREVLGTASCIFKIGDIVEGEEGKGPSRIQYVVFDNDASAETRVLYPKVLDPVSARLIAGGDSLARHMLVAGRDWTLVALPRAGAYRPNREGSALVLALGLLVSFLWSINLRQRSLKHAVIERTVEERTRELNQERLRVQAILKTASDGIHILNADGLLIMANESFLNMLGYDDSVIGKLNVSEWDTTGALDSLRTQYGGLMATHEHRMFETQHRRRDGTLFDVEISASGIKIDGVGYLYAAARDITERKQAEQMLRISAIAFESQEGMVVTDVDSTILRINRAFTEITGYAEAEVVGRQMRLLQSGRHDSAFYAEMWKTLRVNGAWQGEIWNRRKSGEAYPEWLTITAVRNPAGAVTHYVGTLSDITRRKAAEDEVRQLAFFDPLTQLPNRRLLHDRLQQALLACSRTGASGALLFIDLDNFKTLNDTLGHDVGDKLLEQVALRLIACVRDNDTVARLGGDEFVVMLEGLSPNAGAAAAATEVVGRKILAAIAAPYQLDGHDCHSTASVGATLFDPQENAIDELLKRADLAMYEAKSGGRNTLRFFDPGLQAAVNAHATLEAALHDGLRDHAFILHYQAQVDDAGVIVGAEALLRWQHPSLGLLPPSQFIAQAEANGLIIPIGQWVLCQACECLLAWARQPALAHLTLAVNVSARQFHQADFADQVLEILEQSGADPRQLKLELTESVLLDDIEDAIAKMQVLRSKGVKFSLDDFGTGYSSLSYLQRLPLDQLKIDRSFVEGILSSANDDAIAKTIVALAQTLRLAVIAEGVETQAQRDFLALIGCRSYQGFLFSRPLPLSDFEQLVARG